MAGYIGSKAVTLSTTAADVTGDATINGNLTVNGTTITVDSAAAQEIRLGDNDKMTFGDATGGDLQIYHDGFNSYIDDAGTGGLIVRADNFYVRKANDVENMIIGSADGAVTLYHDNATKLATTSTGVDITGTLTSDALNVSAASPNIDVTDTGTSHASQDFLTNSNTVRATIGVERSTGGGLFVGSSAYAAVFGTASSGSTQFATNNNVRMTIDSSGQVGVGTNSPEETLSVMGDFQVALNTSVTGRGLKISTSNGAITDDTVAMNAQAVTGILAFQTNSTERMRINSSGDLLVGISSDYAENVQAAFYGASNGGIALASGTSGLSRLMFADGVAGTAGAYVGSIIYSHADDSMRFNVNGGTERMRIRSDGIVAVNDSSDPTAGGFAPKLHVKQGGDGIFGGFTIEGHNSDVVGGMGYSASSDTFGIGASYRSTAGFKPLAFLTSNSERLRIDTSGNLLLGKTSVSWTIDGTQIESGGETLGVTSSLTGNNFFARKNNATGTMFAFWYNSTSVGSITNTTSSVSYNTSSDHRLKENVTDVTDGITRVKQLAPKRFNFIADPDTTVDGFIAHEAQAVVPEAVTGTHNEVDDDGNAVMQGIDQSKLVPLLTAALQEAIAKIETLETEMTSVKARLDALEAE